MTDKLLLNNLHEAIHILNELNQSLIAEQQALRLRDVASIETNTQNKDKQLKQLARNQESREQLLTSLGLTNNAQGLQKYVESHTKNPNPIKESWSSMQDLLQSTQENNAINGTVIAVSYHNNMRLLDTLSGRSANEGTYAPDGRMYR